MGERRRPAGHWRERVAAKHEYEQSMRTLVVAILASRGRMRRVRRRQSVRKYGPASRRGRGSGLGTRVAGVPQRLGLLERADLRGHRRDRRQRWIVPPRRSDGRDARLPPVLDVPGGRRVQRADRDPRPGIDSFESVEELPESGYSDVNDSTGVAVQAGHVCGFRITQQQGGCCRSTTPSWRRYAGGDRVPEEPQSRFVIFRWAYRCSRRIVGWSIDARRPLLREERDRLSEGLAKRGEPVDVDRLVRLDEEYRRLLAERAAQGGAECALEEKSER